jgi:hypothetical protein
MCTDGPALSLAAGTDENDENQQRKQSEAFLHILTPRGFSTAGYSCRSRNSPMNRVNRKMASVPSSTWPASVYQTYSAWPAWSNRP